jgi:hypothetical protein
VLKLSDYNIDFGSLPGLVLRKVGDEVSVELEVVLLPYDPASMLANIPVG